MRVRLGSVAATALAIAACAACNQKPAVSKAEASGESQGEVVTAIGCPVPGPKPGCVTIKSKGAVYDISSASPAVDLSRGVQVSLTGRAAGEVTACGAKLSDVQVDYLSFHCAAPAAPAAPPS